VPIALEQPVSALRGVGPSLQEKLTRLHIHTIRDLLFHLPLRYQDRTRLSRIGALVPRSEVVIEGTVELAQVLFGRRRSLVVRIADGSGAILLRFFHFNRSQQTRFAQGRLFRCYGEVRRGPQSLEMVHPECHVLDPDAPSALEDRLTPIYPTTEGLQQGRLRKLIDQCLPLLEQTGDVAIPDFIPPALRDELQLPSLEFALGYLHRPPPHAPVNELLDGTHATQQRLAFEELLAHQLSLKRVRRQVRSLRAPRLPRAADLRTRFLRGLGFELTGAQQRVIAEIDTDLATPLPMLRLLQGDVGAGKTAVAAAIALNALAKRHQVAIMAPTELLAEQHRRNFEQWYTPLSQPVHLLTGRLTAKARRQIIAEIAVGEPCLVVGTHALFQDDVSYPRLGLVIVDEQHRFGVHQRLALWDKGAAGDRRPHQLIMTATPIPRTLSMTAYADLDVSILDELPPNRQPVRTVVIPDSRRAEIVERIAHACRNGRQAYWVCPLIDESDLLEAQAATDTLTRLREALPELRIGLVHGRLADREKTAIMREFSAHELDLLVATTVIEVGVDVPNASLMVIENAERLGLSQLHQLRGRVGRGSAAADCLLLYRMPLGDTAKMRLRVMRETNDGFVIAERDLLLRGPGEVLGTKQTGASEFRIADLSRDHALLPLVQRTADELLDTQPALVDRIIERWLNTRVEYGNV
jgi:ATP-dependent DNA helicase RecG